MNEFRPSKPYKTSRQFRMQDLTLECFNLHLYRRLSPVGPASSGLALADLTSGSANAWQHTADSAPAITVTANTATAGTAYAATATAATASAGQSTENNNGVATAIEPATIAFIAMMSMF